MADNIFTPEQQQQLAELMNGLYGITKETDPLIRAKIEEKKASDNAKEALKQLGKQLGNTAIDYSKAVLSAGEGFGKFGGAVTGATNAIGDWASKLGVAGAVVGGFIKIFGEIAAKSLKQNDDLMKSYQNLSDMGSVAAGGFETLKDQLYSVGLIVEEAEKFERVLKPITQQLSQFGGSVTEGRKQLVGVVEGLIGPNNRMEQYLGRLGYSTQDIREGAADFVQRQSKLGLAQGKSQKQLMDESFRYMVTLKELQELTGLSRDEAQKELDAQMSDARMALHVSTLKKEEAQNLQDSMVAFKTKFGPELAAGLQDLVVNQGRITTEAAAAVTQIAPNAYREIMKTLNGDSATRAQMLENVASGIRTNVERLRPSLMIANEGLRDLGAYNRAIIGAMGLLPGSAEKTAEQIKELGKTGKTGSKQLNNNLENEQRARAIRIAGDKVLAEVGEITVGLFTKLNEVMFAFGKTTAKVVDWVSSFLPGKKTNFSALFRDLDDNLKDINAQQDIKDKLLKDIELTKSLIASVEKDKGALTNKIKEKEKEIFNLTKLYQDELKTGTDLNKRKELGEQVAESHRQLRELKSLKNLDNEKLILDRKNKLTKLEEELAKQEKKLLELDKERRKLDPTYNPPAASSASTTTGGQDVNQSAAESKRLGLGSTNNPLPESTSQVLDFVGKYESRGDYNVLVGGKKADLTNMTLGEVLDMQSKLIQSGQNSAAGKYQIKQSTLKGLIDQLGISTDKKFDQSMQDRLGAALLERRGYSEYKSGKISADDFADRLAKEWAALPTRAGRSYYQDDAQGNKSLVSRQDFMNMLDQSLPKAKIGGAFKGRETGYPVLMHGHESIWPDEKLTEMFGQVQRTSIDQYKNELLNTLKTDKSQLQATQKGSIDVLNALGITTEATRKNTDLFAKMNSKSNPTPDKGPDLEWVVETMSRNLPNERLIESLKQAQQSTFTEYQSTMMDALGLKSKNLDLANENIMQNIPDMKGIVDALKQELPKLVETTTPATSTTDNIVAEVMSILSDKLDALIEEHRKTNDIQDQILTYTRA